MAIDILFIYLLNDMPARKYHIECRFGKKWEFIATKLTMEEAYKYIADARSHRYPFRVVRVVRTIIFKEDDK